MIGYGGEGNKKQAGRLGQREEKNGENVV